jgi:hypothetical protein
MGGQACVFYGAAQFSKDVDFALLAEEENFARLRAALAELQAECIAVPAFDPATLARGHAVHFRCRHPAATNLRVDVMTRLRGVADFAVLWERRTTIEDNSGESFDLLAVEDLVQAKKTQRAKDWPMIEAHFREFQHDSTPRRIAFWLAEARSPERLVNLAERFPSETDVASKTRPLLRHALAGNLDELRPALDAEVREEQARDREYWNPLRAELEAMRREWRTETEE